jgi:hypothetical protein
MTEEQLKLKITEAGITVHRNMAAPTDVINGRSTCANTRFYTDTFVDILVQHKISNFSFYKFVQQSDSHMIRYAAW